MGIAYSTDIVIEGLRHCFDLENTKSYNSGTTITDLITSSSGTNGIPNNYVSWMNEGVYSITLIAVITRLAANPAYAVNPFTKYVGTTDNTFNLYMFGNFNGTDPSSDGVLRYYSYVNGSWQGVGSSYSSSLNETVMYTLQYNSNTGGQAWANSVKLGSRTGGGKFGSSNNISNLLVATPSFTSTLRLENAFIYDRELTDAEIIKVFNSLKDRRSI